MGNSEYKCSVCGSLERKCYIITEKGGRVYQGDIASKIPKPPQTPSGLASK